MYWLQVQLEEQSRIVSELESSLETQARELDNRLTEQQQLYESEINSLLVKISEKENVEPNTQQFIKYVVAYSCYVCNTCQIFILHYFGLLFN